MLTVLSACLLSVCGRDTNWVVPYQAKFSAESGEDVSQHKQILKDLEANIQVGSTRQA